jgi:hypothetical protein
MDEADLKGSLLKELVGDIPGYEQLQFVKDIIWYKYTNDGEHTPVEDYNEDIPSISTLQQKVKADIDKYRHIAASGLLEPPIMEGENWERTSCFGICSTSVLSLFLDLRVPKNHVLVPVGCQPDINAKRFTKPWNESPLNARLPCPLVTAVVYKAVGPTSRSSTSEDSKTSLHRIQPMNVSDPSQSTVYGNQFAENLGVPDFDSAFRKLLGVNISELLGPNSSNLIQDEDWKPSVYILVLVSSINNAFNLQEEKGWRVLLKQLAVFAWKDNAVKHLKALALSDLQVRQCAILAFSAIINVKTAFLIGEGVMLGMKDFLQQDTTGEFLEARPFYLDIITPSTFGEDTTFCPKILKKVSHELCSTVSFNMSKTGSLADFILQKALDDATSATASGGGADTSTQMTLDDGNNEDDYMRKLTTAQERALELLSDNKRHNPQVQAIFQNFIRNGKTSTGTSMDNSAALIKTLMPKINIQYSPHSNRRTPQEFFWAVGLLTQWEEQSSAQALFSVLQSDEKASE